MNWEGKAKIQTETESRDNALIRAAANGDRDAFRELYETYRDPVFTLLYYSTGNSELAEDLLHNVFLQVHGALRKFRFESSFKTWIHRIAINEVKNRRRQTREYVPLAMIVGSSRDLDPALGPHHQHANRERRDMVRRAVLSLAPKLRDAIVLKYVDGLSYEEMGKILGCSPGTVASRLSRALTQLEERLRQFQNFI